MGLKHFVRKMAIAVVFGKERVSRKAYVTYLQQIGVRVGYNLYIADPINCQLDITRPWLLEIGNDVCITDHVTVLTHDFSFSTISKCSMGTYPICGKVTIGDNVFIGSHAIILPGVNVGNNAIIGAGSVVTKDVKDGEIVAGSPARVVNTIDKYKEKINGNMFSSLRELVDEYYKVYGKLPPEDIMTEYYGLYMSYEDIQKKYPIYLTRLIKEKHSLNQIYSSYDEMIKDNCSFCS